MYEEIVNFRAETLLLSHFFRICITVEKCHDLYEKIVNFRVEILLPGPTSRRRYLDNGGFHSAVWLLVAVYGTSRQVGHTLHGVRHSRHLGKLLLPTRNTRL